MAIKSDIIDFPLKGELNLSKNKIDISSPAEGGYLKNDGVLYGNILTPIQHTDDNVGFDYIDSNENRYNISSNKLTKGQTDVMSFDANHFEKETLDYTNVDSLYSKNHWIEITNTGAIVHKGATQVETETITGTVLATKMIQNDGYAVLYYDSSNELHIKFKPYGTFQNPYVIDLDIPTDIINAPVIAMHYYENSNNPCIVISLVTDSGQAVGSHYALSWAWNATNGLKELSYTPTSSTPETSKAIEKYGLEAFQYSANWYGTSGGSMTIKPRQRIWVGGWRQSDLNPQIRLYYQQTNGYVSPRTANNTPIDESTSTLLATITPQTRGFPYTGQWAEDVVVGIKRNHYLDSFNLEHNSEYEVAGFFWLEIDSAIAWKDEYTQEEVDEAVNEQVRFKWVPTICAWTEPENRVDYYHVQNIDLPSTYCKKDGFEYDGNFNAQKWKVAYVESKVISSTNQTCDAILDDGTIIQTQVPESSADTGTFEEGSYNFTGHFSSITFDSSADKYFLNYIIYSSEAVLLGQASTDTNYKYPVRLVGSSISLGWNYYRSNLVTEGVDYQELNETTGETETKNWRTVLLFDAGFANSNGGVLMQSGYNTAYGIYTGSVVQTGNWRVLYNNNLLSAISYSEDNNQIGSLLTDWLSVSKILSITENDAFYLDNEGRVQHISVVSNSASDAPYTIIRDRFIVINTTSYNNCWDIKLNKPVHWASDWNNRIYYGRKVPNRLKITEANDSILAEMTIEDIMSYASAQNANYEMTSGRSVSSAVFPPEVISNVYLDKVMMIRGETNESIDFYRAESGLVVLYVNSYKNGAFYKDIQLEGAYYPVSDSASSSIMFNPNMFTRFIRTYNNNDMIINNDVAYPLMKYNGNIIMLFLMTKGMENMENIFVLQTLYYGIGDGKIWEIYYDNNTITNYQAIIDVTGMTYLGQLPTEALFWSPMNRSIYSFTGDAILKQLWHCNDISTIYNTFYNPSTQELFISTDKGLLCISNSYTYMIDRYKQVYGMFFFDNHFRLSGLVHNYETHEDETKYVTLSYERGNHDTPAEMHLKTKYLGDVGGRKIHINAVYLKVFKLSESDEAYVTFDEQTLTDKTTDVNSRTLPVVWDANEPFGYLRYQPQYQKGSAITFDIRTNVPIISMSYGFNYLDENPYQGRVNA